VYQIGVASMLELCIMFLGSDSNIWRLVSPYSKFDATANGYNQGLSTKAPALMTAITHFTLPCTGLNIVKFNTSSL
jgi:hypothetical protein